MAIATTPEHEEIIAQTQASFALEDLTMTPAEIDRARRLLVGEIDFAAGLAEIRNQYAQGANDE